VWQNPEIDFDVDIEKMAMEEAEKVCYIAQYATFISTVFVIPFLSQRVAFEN